MSNPFLIFGITTSQIAKFDQGYCLKEPWSRTVNFNLIESANIADLESSCWIKLMSREPLLHMLTFSPNTFWRMLSRSINKAVLFWQKGKLYRQWTIHFMNFIWCYSTLLPKLSCRICFCGQLSVLKQYSILTNGAGKFFDVRFCWNRFPCYDKGHNWIFETMLHFLPLDLNFASIVSVFFFYVEYRSNWSLRARLFQDPSLLLKIRFYLVRVCSIHWAFACFLEVGGEIKMASLVLAPLKILLYLRKFKLSRYF